MFPPREALSYPVLINCNHSDAIMDEGWGLLQDTQTSSMFRLTTDDSLAASVE